MSSKMFMHFFLQSKRNFRVCIRAARYFAVKMSVKMFLWLALNLHQLFSNGAAFNTQSRSSLTSYAICAQNRRWIACDSEREIALLVSDLRLCVLNAAPFENNWWRFTANQRTVFTDEMRMTIACNIPCSPSLYPYSEFSPGPDPDRSPDFEKRCSTQTLSTGWVVGEGGMGVAVGVGECVKCRSERVLGVSLAISNQQ